MIFLLLFNYLIVLISSSEIHELKDITFGGNSQSELKGTGIFKVVASYQKDVSQKYLYICPQNYETEMYLNKAIFKIYFQEDTEKNANYLEADYSTLDFNSGLFIEIKSLTSNKANIYIIAYDEAKITIQYRYADDISFPKEALYTNLQLNQFKLEKGGTKTINYRVQRLDNEYLTILSKTSLRNIDVTVNYNEKDYTKEIATILYPNGYSIFIDSKDAEVFDKKHLNYTITIKNKNIRDEVILLGYMHHGSGEIFANKLVNGYQMYLESNSNNLLYLLNVEKGTMNQYFTYQTFSKKADMVYTGNLNAYYYLNEYNSMIKCNADSNNKIKFEFEKTPRSNALYIQYLDYNDIEVAQKSLQPLVTGSPKSILIPAKSSLYHFLPKERESNNINYYLRPRTPNDQKIFISFRTCKNYPEECVIKNKDNNSVNLINNLGLWYREETNKNELQIIYVYCEEECAYDILMTYDNDPLFIFPESNYTKFIGEEGEDIFILPVFESLSANQSINIDLSIISGNAELTLYKSLDNKDENKLNIQKEIFGKKQSYIISNDSYSVSDYYKKDIYALVKGDKNTFYNLMYGAGATNDKTLDNNRVIVESEYVGAQTKKRFIFKNEGKKFFISISTPKCKSNIIFDGKADENLKNKNNHLKSITAQGIHAIQVELIEDQLCKKDQKEEIILYAYNDDNTNILLSENTLVNGSVEGKEITFRHIFKPDFEKNDDKSLSVELERLSNAKSFKFEYKLEKISFNSSAIKESKNSQLSTFVFDQKANLISNKQIKDICGSLDQNEICSLSLTLSLETGSGGFSFSLYLNNNGRFNARHLVDETLINTINQKSARYYYIDVNKEYDTEILINSYGQDLFYSYVVESGSKTESEIIPFNNLEYKGSSNYHKIQVEASKCSDSTCRIYLAVYAKANSLEKEVPTTFEISYLYKKENVKQTNVKLPLNYWAQYTFDSLSEITYSLQSYDQGKMILELYAIKENENDNCELVATWTNNEFSSVQGSKEITITEEELAITIKPNSKDSKCKFRFRAYSLGRNDVVIPILPYSSEKCVIAKANGICYFALDISPENEADTAYFYVPESEDAFIAVHKVAHGLVENQNENLESYLTNITLPTKDESKRSNWHEEDIKEKNKALIIGVKVPNAINVTLHSSFYNKPEEVTLDEGEKKIFTIEHSSKTNSMSFKIKKSNSQISKYKINIHAVKGNGLFSVFTESYPLGLDYNNKENITIVIDKSDNDIEIVAKNEYNEGDINEFVFSIDYTITTLDQLFYELEPSRINSFKVIKPGASDLPLMAFYMKVNTIKNVYNDVNMNVKIFSSSKYEIKASLVGEDFIKEKLTNVNKQPDKQTAGEVTQYIGDSTDSDFTFYKIEIPASKLSTFKEEAKNEVYVYVTFSKSDKLSTARIDIYPYDIKDSLPLAQNELFVHKLPAGSISYQLLLSKSEYGFRNMFIEYLSPASNKYKMAVGNLVKENAEKNPITNNDTDIIDLKSNFLYFGKNKLNVNENSEDNKLRFLLFNVFPDANNLETKADQFIFKYKSSWYKEIVSTSDQKFEVDDTSGVKFKFDASIPLYSSGNSIFIIKAYKQSDVESLNYDNNYLSLYLLFSDIKPSYTLYKSLTKDKIKKSIEQEVSIEWKEGGGNFIFTCVNVIVDNERTEYLGYTAVSKEMKSSSNKLLDYMRNHIFATILIFIIILFVCGMICNIIRIDSRPPPTVNKIEVGEIMKDV